ncbi:MAG TPA: PilZ domain-containing protein, partial [Candidatus Acidoferrum sp.]
MRKRTDQLLYAEFGPENGSILLNLSEEGCSFQSMAPVREEQLRFSVSVGDGRKLEGDGQMVWSDTAKKIGGLRFVNPSEELREQVREWLEATLVTADGKL